ncbi:MAG: hypothetical protein RLZ37_1916 [Actinomycetota bacterium]
MQASCAGSSKLDLQRQLEPLSHAGVPHAPHVRSTGIDIPFATDFETEVPVIGNVVDGFGLEIHTESVSSSPRDPLTDEE